MEYGGSIVSLFSGVQGGASAKNEFVAFQASQNTYACLQKDIINNEISVLQKGRIIIFNVPPNFPKNLSSTLFALSFIWCRHPSLFQSLNDVNCVNCAVSVCARNFNHVCEQTRMS